MMKTKLSISLLLLAACAKPVPIPERGSDRSEVEIYKIIVHIQDGTIREQDSIIMDLQRRLTATQDSELVLLRPLLPKVPHDAGSRNRVRRT
jgi:hypothetical protein